MKAEEYRNNGAVGALLDEYEKSIDELICVIEDVVPMELTHIVDAETVDLDCRSIQSILTHVVQSGYTYVVEIRKWLGENVTYRNKVSLLTAEDYASALKEMFRYSEDLFADYPSIAVSVMNDDHKIHVRWGQRYDVEQLMEHAIVHILRHRRQVERFKLRLACHDES